MDYSQKANAKKTNHRRKKRRRRKNTIGMFFVRLILILGIVGCFALGGAVLGAYLMAFAETACAVYLSSTYKDAVVFLILMVVLVFFPSGIFPKNSAAKRS